jgi:hypothetical protein
MMTVTTMATTITWVTPSALVRHVCWGLAGTIQLPNFQRKFRRFLEAQEVGEVLLVPAGLSVGGVRGRWW